MTELSTVLRTWRDRMSPQDAGLPAGAGRRAAGLRREELAALAGLSVDYLVRLEQGRSTNPSPQTLTALARALRLSDDERDHLFRVAGSAPPGRDVVQQHVPAGVQRIVDRLGDTPVAVYSAAWDILLWNPLWAALLGDPSASSRDEANVVWRHFTVGPGNVVFDEQHAIDFADDLVADLRAASGRYPDDPRLAGLISRLNDTSAAFAERWSTARVAVHRTSYKTVGTPVGPIELDCDVLSAPGSDLKIVVYTAAAGSDAASRLQLLAVTGLQETGAVKQQSN
jgi:transcriptional regulator with XRE-family HTH domain